MQFTNILVSFLLSTAVAAKNSTKTVSDKSLCKEMAQLSSVVSLAANSTKLAAKEKNNATKIAEYQSKASTAATQLATLYLNTTLVATCNVIAAAQKTEADCDEIDSINSIMSLAANETKLAAKEKNNATKIAEYQAKASDASTKLATLQANTTLTNACASIKSAKEAQKAG